MANTTHSENAPLLRASYLQGNIASLAKLGRDAEQEVLALMGSDLQIIRSAIRTAWLPLELDIKLTEAIYSTAGEEGVISVNCASLVNAAGGPLLRPLFHGAFRLFGTTPHGLLRVVPAGIEAATRNFGHFTVRAMGPQASRMLHDDMPDLLRGNTHYATGFLGVLDGICELTQTKGTRSMHFAEDGRSVRYDLTW